MALKESQLKEKFMIVITMSPKSNNKWWTFNKKQINSEIKLKPSTNNNNFIISFKKDSKLSQMKSEILKGNLLTIISLLINLELIQDLKMLKSLTNTLKIKTKNSRLNLMMFSFKEKKFNKKLRRFKINWPASISKWSLGSMSLIQVKEVSIKDLWMKTMILWLSTVKSKIKWKNFSVNLLMQKINLKWTVKNLKVNFLRNKSLIYKPKKLIMKFNLTKQICHYQKQEIVFSTEWNKITLWSQIWKKGTL